MDRNAIFFPDGSFAAPRHVANIDDIPESHRDWYEPHGGGPKPFRLKQHVWAELKPLVAEIETIERQAVENIAKLDAKIAASKLARHNERVSTALNAELANANVPSALVRGAASILQEKHEFQIEQGYEDEAVIYAETVVGLQSLPGLVESFLESEEGTGYRPKRAAPEPGYFSNLMAQLRQRR
ncbi:hypothetical protein [Mesorhizobium sp. CN2-181]|uniref:hypothetical protein n=1 Tax=Mesorhizobium yinganensis TaxID=3157707 RepID=UPI0032B83B59